MQFRPVLAGAWLAALLAWTGFATGQALKPPGPVPQSETFLFGAEWRFVRAGEVEVKNTSDTQIDMRLKTVGLVGSLLTVNNTYRAESAPGWCAKTTLLEAHEGKKHRETRVTFDSEKKRAYYLEKDLTRDAIVSQQEIDVPACIHEMLGGLQQLRRTELGVGQSTTVPISDGKKAIQARVDAQTREQITTRMGTFQTVRFEAHVFNGAIFRRKGRLFVWVSDDDRRLPVQIKVQLPFYIGTVTLQLEKAERK